MLFYTIAENSVEACVSFDANRDAFFLNVKWNVSSYFMCIVKHRRRKVGGGGGLGAEAPREIILLGVGLKTVINTKML